MYWLIDLDAASVARSMGTRAVPYLGRVRSPGHFGSTEILWSKLYGQNFFHEPEKSILRTQLDQYVPCVLNPEQLGGPIPLKITQKLAFGLTKRSQSLDFKILILGPKYRHFMSIYREN